MNKIFLLLTLLLSLPLCGQQITVRESNSGQPLSDVEVYNANQSKSITSDINGACDLSMFDISERITFRHLGYTTKSWTKENILRRGAIVLLSAAPEQLNEVVVSISKWEQQQRDIPQKITAITADQILFNNPQTSADLLQQTGQVFIQKSQLGGGSPMIRGFATNRVLLSVDGVRMNNAIFRGGNLQNVISIDPLAVQRSEIIFGPGSVIYGSDAIGGVMNFITKPAQFATSDSLAFSGNTLFRYGSANNENTVHLDFNLGKRHWAFLTSVSYNEFGDLKMGSHGPESYFRNFYVATENGTDELLTNEDPKRQIPSGYNQLSLMQKISHQPADDLQYDLGIHYSETSSYSRYDRLIRPDGSGDGLRSAEWYYGPQKWLMGNLQLNKSGNNTFFKAYKITGAYQYFEESRIDRNFQDPTRFMTREKVDALTLGVDFVHQTLGNLQLYYGSEYIYNKVTSLGSQQDINEGTTIAAASRYPDGSSWQSAAAYVNGLYKAGTTLSILSGLRYSQVWLSAEFDPTFYQFPFDTANLNNGALTGSLGISWFPEPKLQITANAGTAFRSPNIDDVGKIFESEPGSVVVPNPDLQPEYAYNAELGIKKNFNDRLVLRGATFYTYLQDALVRRDFLFNGQDEIIYNGEPSNVQAIQNAARAYVYGFELSADAYLGDRISVSTHYTFTHGVEEDDAGVDTPARHAAPTFADVHLIWDNQKFRADLFLNYNGEILFEDLTLSEISKDYLYATDENGNPFSPAWYTLNLRSQYAISTQMKATVTLENFTDQRYRPYSSGIVASGINFIAGLSYAF